MITFRTKTEVRIAYSIEATQASAHLLLHGKFQPREVNGFLLPIVTNTKPPLYVLITAIEVSELKFVFSSK